jgi:hypothetical protein
MVSLSCLPRFYSMFLPNFCVVYCLTLGRRCWGVVDQSEVRIATVICDYGPTVVAQKGTMAGSRN